MPGIDVRRKRMLLVAVASVVFAAVASLASLYLFASWTIGKQRDFFFDERTAGAFLKLVEEGVTVGRTVIGPCKTTEDLSSIGNKDKEYQMEVLSQLLTLSEAKTGAPAATMHDLDSLPRLTQPRAAYVERLREECSVLSVREGATLLNCDGLVLSPKIVQDVSRLSPTRRRFYIIEGHEVLFRPVVKCN